MKLYHALGAVCATFLILAVGYMQPTMMTREQAGQIALQFAQVGNYPGNLHWLTPQELPAGQEVDEGNSTLIDQLAAQGKNWTITKKRGPSDWFGARSYADTYIFHVTFGQFPDRTAIATVNAWTGYCVLESFRKEIEETNTQLGLGGLPVKTIDELRNIALNIAQQLLGTGNYDVLTVPYTPDKQQLLADYFWGFVIFKVNPQTGAHLPQMVELFLNSRTGQLEYGRLWNRPVSVSTIPSISKQEAKNMATQFLAQSGITVTGWLDDGFYGGQIFNKTALPYNAVVGLYVIENDLQQSLKWIFIFTFVDESGQTKYEFVSVDAHTGQVSVGANLPIELSLKRSPLGEMKQKEMKERSKKRMNQEDVGLKKWYASLREQLQREKKYGVLEMRGIIVNGNPCIMGDPEPFPFFPECIPMILFKGRVYIKAKSAAIYYGVKWDGKQRRLKGKRGEVILKPSEQREYFGQLYISLRRVCEVAGIRLVGWNNELKAPMLWWK